MKTAALTYAEAGNLITDSSIGLITDAERVGVRSFFVFFEHAHFPPGTAQNQDFQFMQILWQEITWFLCIFPRTKLPEADAQLKTLGLRRADGVPTMVTSGGVSHFPIQKPNLYTIETISGHFAYRNDPALNKTAAKFEQEAIDAFLKTYYRK